MCTRCDHVANHASTVSCHTATLSASSPLEQISCVGSIIHIQPIASNASLECGSFNAGRKYAQISIAEPSGKNLRD